MIPKLRSKIDQIVETLEIGDELFWEPLRTTRPGAWAGHLTTAFWLVKAVTPNILVELGTQSGNSYSAFCQAISLLGLSTRAFAVDTWKGDEHSGLYGEDVFAELNAFNENHFAGFSKLLRTTFDEARPYFADGSVDLLHIDGYHSYEAVRHDFETWKSAMSPSGVVVFHDTNVRERGFGVWKLWKELAAGYPSFEFSHSEGLGILGLGNDQSPLARRLFELAKSSETASLVQRLFSARGETFRGRVRGLDLEFEAQILSRDLEWKSERLSALEKDLVNLQTLAGERGEELQRKDETIHGLESEVQSNDEVIREQEQQLQRKDETIHGLESEVQSNDEVIREREQVLQRKDETIHELERAIAALNRGRDNARKEFEVERNRLQRELSDSTEQSQQAAKRLADAAQHLVAVQADSQKTAQQSAIESAMLKGIMQSRGWRVLSAYYKVRQKMGIVIPRRIRASRQLRQDRRLVGTSGLFDPQWYLQQYSDVTAAGVDPMLHYLHHGAFEGRDPSPRFDSDWYLQRNCDVAESGMNPLVHYLRWGAKEGRAPQPNLHQGRDSSSHFSADGDVSWKHKDRAGSDANGSHKALERQLQIRPICEHVRNTNRNSNGARGPLLCFTHVLPYPTRAGNEYGIHRLLQWLVEYGYEIYLIVCPLGDYPITPDLLEEACTAYPNLILCNREGLISYHLANGSGAVQGLSGLHPRDFAGALGEEEGAEVSGRLLNLLRTFCPDTLIEVVLHLNFILRPKVVVAQYVFMTRVLPLLGNDVVKLVHTHDVFSTKHAKVVRFGIQDSLTLTAEEEGIMLNRCDMIIAVQPEEERELRSLAPGKIVVTAGSSFDPIEAAPSVAQRPVILMVGSDNAMNVKGAKDFLRFAWPLVTRQLPEAELRIVGAVCGRLEVDDPSVKLLGAVKDLDDEYRAARAVVNPVVAGTGLKIKTVESICHLRPTITWPSGVEGLTDSVRALCRVATNWYGFARCVIEVCTSDRASQEMISKRDDIREAFSSPIIYGDLRKALEAAAAARDSRAREV